MYCNVPYNPRDWFRLSEEEGYGTRLFTHHLFQRTPNALLGRYFQEKHGVLAEVAFAYL